MSKFEILCVTMHQNDFSKIERMNIHSDVVFANQADTTSYESKEFDGHSAKMITTITRGVGKNRNIALLYASADICLFADDDVTYYEDLEKKIVQEFEEHPKADIIIFNLDTDTEARKQRYYKKTRKHGRFEKMPWGAVRVAFRLDSVRKANLHFTELFGGGCLFPSGEDSMWLTDAKRAGLEFYISKEIIGTISFERSSWYTGRDKKYFYGRGAFYQAVHPRLKYLWMLYFAYRARKDTTIKFFDRIKLMKHGAKGYKKSIGFNDYFENRSLKS